MLAVRSAVAGDDGDDDDDDNWSDDDPKDHKRAVSKSPPRARPTTS